MTEVSQGCKIPNFCEEFRQIQGDPYSITAERQIAILGLSTQVNSMTIEKIFACANKSFKACPIKYWMLDLLEGNRRINLQR